MLLEELEKLLTQKSLEKFQSILNKNFGNEELYKNFDDGETLFHRLVKKNLPESLKIKFIFKLSDCGIDINAQNTTNSQTCLHLAVIRGQADVVFCLLQNGADLTITDREGLCSYNRARRLEDHELSKKIISKMQWFYPTYWIGIDNSDINVIRRLVNSWCRFNVSKKGKSLIEYAKMKNFREAFEIFQSLEITMDLCSAVLACNVEKVENLITNKSSEIKLNFKNMKENNSTILYYAIQENNQNLLKALLKLKPYILGEYINDELDIDYPLYFTSIKYDVDEECLKLLTPEIKDLKISQHDISCLYYKGMSFLRYSMENNLNVEKIEDRMDLKYCSKELITVKDPNYYNCKEYALKIDRKDYAEMIDRITVKYILNSKKLRMEMALNGYDFSPNDLQINGENLLSFAKRQNLMEICLFLENLDEYQEKIEDFHDAVEKNDYYKVKAKYKCIFDNEELNGIFYSNLITSKTKNESQSVLFKAVLNGNYEILNLLLDLAVSEPEKMFTKFDELRDHCYRTPMHYASGYNDNRKMSQLLSQYGFSENVFDKDGMTPLDFQERIQSEELQELILNHKKRKFDCEEPNPWSWRVWTRIQREKNTLKQIMSFSNSKSHSHHHGHSHNHVHAHSHDSYDESQEPPITPNGYCLIL
ncbi:unnamed protein product [Brachionus calyciflorus]|uniref:Uncharacterized protein n=1 Tax=Brachionus calyciflorus TaxID=104777 RepID=A0A813M5C6_9BILA|nr:unnamed protein product [Brachionus calyciflorus]